MSNTYGNAYPALGINSDNQVFGVDTNNQIHPLSKAGFAETIGISQDGIIWAISTTPDPGTGSYLYWSKADGNWNPTGNVDGDAFLTGTGAGMCLVYTLDGTLWAYNVDGSRSVITNINDLQDMDYGGTTLWAVFPTTPGGVPCLQFWNVMQTPPNWVQFQGSPAPSGISCSYNGDCYGVVDFSPIYYSGDGKTSNSAGSGANGSTLEMSFKNNFYGLSTNADKNGNQVLIWVDEMGGVFQNAGFQAIQVLATYYLGS